MRGEKKIPNEKGIKEKYGRGKVDERYKDSLVLCYTPISRKPVECKKITLLRACKIESSIDPDDRGGLVLRSLANAPLV